MSEKSSERTERDGGQAYPQFITVSPSGDVYPAYPGMSVRDWFAGQALAGLLASPRGPADGSKMTDSGAAQAAYLVADAMLKERAK